MRALLAAVVLLAAPAGALAQDDPRWQDSAREEPGHDEFDAQTAGELEEPHAEEGEAHATSHHDAHIDWWAIGAGVVNFVLLLWILVRLARKPLSSYLVDRRNQIEQDMAEAARLKKEAEARHAEYESRLKALDKEIAALRQEMIDAGVAERDRIIADAQAKAERMRKDAQFLIDQQMKQLRIDLTREAVTAAVAAAEEQLRAQASPQDQERIARDYLTRLTKGGAA